MRDALAPVLVLDVCHVEIGEIRGHVSYERAFRERHRGGLIGRGGGASGYFSIDGHYHLAGRIVQAEVSHIFIALSGFVSVIQIEDAVVCKILLIG